MEEENLKQVAQLFEKAGAGDDADGNSDFWEKRFQEFVKTSMAEHVSRMKQLNGNAPAEKQEVWRARQALFAIVQERLEARFKDISAGVAEAARELAAAQVKIFEEVLESSGREATEQTITSSAGDETGFTPNASIGSAAFAAARRQASDGGSVVSGSVPDSSVFNGGTLRGTMTSQAGMSQAGGSRNGTPGGGGKMTGKMTNLEVSWRAYCDAFSEAGSSEDKDSQSPTFTKSPFDLMWGSSNSNMRGGPATLGAGAQDMGLRPPPPGSMRTYSNMHKKNLSAKGLSPSQGTAPKGPIKELSLRMLRDIINAVYASKAQHDMKCQDNKEPTETMEQHLYSFLGKRYGLKSVVQEWASAIFRAIQKFAPQENDVAVFGKILQNTLSESFPSVQDQLKQTAKDLLWEQLEERHPRRPRAEIEALWRARQRCGVPLSECQEVVQQMYNQSDSDELMLRLTFASKNASAETRDTEPLAVDSVRMWDMLQVLLSFQMSLTEAFLSDFVQIFKQVDSSENGVLDFTCMEELIRRVGYIEGVEEGRRGSYIPSLITGATVLREAQATAYTSIKKFKSGATFSQCVDLFTGLISARWGALKSSD